MIYHPFTIDWFSLNLGLDKVPSWYKRKHEFISAITQLNTYRQTCHYMGADRLLFDRYRYHVCRRFKASYAVIDTCLGVCSVDPSNPYGILADWFDGAEPRIKRTTR